jgi:hypothetical protein
MHLHAYVLPISPSYTLSSADGFMSIGAGFGIRNPDRGDEYVRYGFIIIILKTYQEEHVRYEAFARVELDC